MKKIIVSIGFVFASLFLMAQSGKLIAEKSGKGAVLIHEVQAKEGLYSISRNYGIKVAEIAAANDFDKDKSLLIGQRIKIPLTEANLSQKKGKSPVYYNVSDGESLTSISNRFNKIPVKELKSWNKIEGDVVPKDKDLIVGYFTGTAVTASVVPTKKEEEKAVDSKKNISKGQPAIITGSNINVRKGPATDQPVVATAQLDEVVDILRIINKEWAFIRTSNGTEGYIASQFLKSAEKKEEIKKSEPKKPVILKTAFITGTNINIRKGPSTSEVVVSIAQQDDVVEIVKTVNDEWTSIRTKDGTEGFVASQFLNTTGKKASTPKEEVLKTASIIGTNINVRKGPATTEPAIASVQQDDVVTILKQGEGDWTAIRLADGTEGFIASQFLNTDGAKPKPDLAQKEANIEKAKDETIEKVVDNIEKKVGDKEIAKTIAAEQKSFKDIFLSQGNPNFTTEKTVASGIFKTNKGWNNEEYYLLIDGPVIGSIVKVMNPESAETIYAKVLGKMSGLAYKDGFDIRLSEAAANKLKINNKEKFSVRIAY